MNRLNIKTGVRKYQNKAVDLGSWTPPSIRTRTADGDVVIEKIPSAGHCKMVNPAGHVVRVQLFNGMGKPSGGDPYYMQIGPEKLEKGFIPYGQCPKSLGLADSIPEKVRGGASCELGIDKSKPISDMNPCKCVVATEEHRKSRNAKSNQDVEKRYQSKASKQSSDLASAVTSLTELVSGGRESK